MALGSTIHTFDIDLADVDRGVYENISLRVARHPSETEAFMVTRLLAYLLEYEEGIGFSPNGIASTDEPAVQVRDLTGRMTAWIEVGNPDAERIHFGSKLADRVAVYTHRDPEKLLANWSGKKIHQAEQIVLRSFDPSFIDAIATGLDRRNTMSASVTESQLYVDLAGTTHTSQIVDSRIE